MLNFLYGVTHKQQIIFLKIVKKILKNDSYIFLNLEHL